MLNFRTTKAGVDFDYQPEFGTQHQWVWEEMKNGKSTEVSRVFSFRKADLKNPPTKSTDFTEYVYTFRFGTFEDEYLRIPGRVFSIERDVLVSRELRLKRSVFVAERNVSIMKRLSGLLDNDEPIVIGGGRAGNIPLPIYQELLRKFPTTHELNRYASARVHTILSQYVDGMKDARGLYESYLDKKSALNGTFSAEDPPELTALKEQEVLKYRLIYDEIQQILLTGKNLSEKEWQRQMVSFLPLLFPKYIRVLQNITINDYYSKSGKTSKRYIDVGLVDASGNLDVIELKKPFEDKILRQGLYRGNNIPTAELAGSVMQAEKYLFHLSKWGVDGERALTKAYASELPPGLEIRISNPKAIIIVGRSQIGGKKMTDSQQLDFEIIKRKYANMMDIITYDDLLGRLQNTIYALEH
ncbi:DUF4263 domain-containing protein [Burkholderia sp. Bp8994]|uniref:Shedu immune nuclease family protein n=1 Tax=Burkholderia sp. Bp8994 TaxID=2184555 RepID=UPI000F595B23|nr:Shedu immune nuclease family protein [Burkholderia sp. Bp8994]RQR96767.1 DUF4263 domain-containing protein [Burkholderia sp. Bp8994]